MSEKKDEKTENLKTWARFASVPEFAKKPITGGRLKGFTDISPQWRLLALTDLFGPCGEGWWTETLERWIDGHDELRTANIRIALKYWTNDGKIASIEGEGGSMMVSKEKGQGGTHYFHFSDEAWKMAKTDALSVCCKQLGIGADVYMNHPSSKYLAIPQEKAEKTKKKADSEKTKEEIGKELIAFGRNDLVSAELAKFGKDVKLYDLPHNDQVKVLQNVRFILTNEEPNEA